jgi:hypothetical protein
MHCSNEITPLNDLHPDYRRKLYQWAENGHEEVLKETTRAAALLNCLEKGQPLEESLAYSGLSLKTVCGEVAYSSQHNFRHNYPSALYEPFSAQRIGRAQIAGAFTAELGVIRTYREVAAWNAGTLEEMAERFAHAAEMAPLFEWITSADLQLQAGGGWLQVRFEARDTAFAPFLSTGDCKPEEKLYQQGCTEVLDSLGLDFLGRREQTR